MREAEEIEWVAGAEGERFAKDSWCKYLHNWIENRNNKKNRRQKKWNGNHN